LEYSKNENAKLQHNDHKTRNISRTSESNLHKINNFKEVQELNERLQSLEEELNELKITSSQEIDQLMMTIRELNEQNTNSADINK